MSRILVLGAAGMLGHKMVQELVAEGHDVVGSVRGNLSDHPPVAEFLTSIAPIVDQIDVSRFETVATLIAETDPEIVINCVGIVKQRAAALDAVPSISINALFPHLLAGNCATSNRRLIHFSTDCVFSASRGGYTEEDDSDAQDLYGRTKYLGEVGSPALTLRTSIVGRELSSFESLVEWLVAQSGGRVEGFQKAMYNGVTTLQAARAVAIVIADHKDLDGLYQMVGPIISKYDLLREIDAAMGLNIAIVPNTEFVLDRTLVGERFTAATGIVAPSWREMIDDMTTDPTPYELLR